MNEVATAAEPSALESFDAYLEKQGLAGQAPAPAPSVTASAQPSTNQITIPQGQPQPSAPQLPRSAAVVDSLSQFNDYLGKNGLDVRNVPKTSTGEMISPAHMTEEKYISRNREGDVPLDIHTGAGAWERLQLGARRNKLDQLDLLRQMHGSDKIRLDSNGEFIFRSTDAQGQAKDIKVNESQMTARDLLDLTSEAPAFALSLLTSKGIPVKSVFKNALASAGGYAAGGVASDIASRAGTDRPVDLNEILSNRGSDALSQTLFGSALGKGISMLGALPRIANVAASKLGDTTKSGALAEIETGRQAVEKFSGVRMEPTIAELTGNPTATRLEAFFSNIPFVRNMILKKWQRQLENEKAVQSSLFGGQTPDISKAGQGVMDVLSSELQGAQGIAGKAADVVRSQTTKAITDPLADIPGAALSPFQLGTRMTRRGEAQLQNFKDKAGEMFNAVKSQPDAELPLFSANPIKQEAEKIKAEELVNKNKTTENIAYDQYGNPSAVESTSKQPIKELIPTGVDPILKAVSELPDQQSYFDLTRLRQSIYDRLSSPEPISSRGTYLLKRLGATVTQQLDEQGPKVLQPDTQALAEAARKFYADKVDTFYQKGIIGMLKPRTEAGAVDPELIASRLLAGGKGSITAYNTLASFFEKPQAIQDMNRLFRDHILNAGTDQATGLIKLEDLAGYVSRMEPEMVQKIFGQDKAKLLKTVQQGGLAVASNLTEGLKNLTRGSQASIQADELKKLIDSGQVNSYAIRKLVNSAKDLGEQYSNSIRRAVDANDFGVVEAAPETFAKQYLFNPSVPFKDVKNVMQSVYRHGDPELISDVRRAYLGEIFADSAKAQKGDVGQIVARVKGTPLRDLDPQALSIKLEDIGTRERLEEILGREQFDNLKSFALSIGGRAQRDLAGSMTGAFAGGSIFEKALHGLEGLSDIPQYAALAYLMTSPKSVSMIRGASKLSPLNVDQVVRSAVMTPEFFRAVSQDATSPQEAAKIAQEIKAWHDKAQGQPAQQ